MKKITDNILSFTDDKEFLEYIKSAAEEPYDRFIVSYTKKGLRIDISEKDSTEKEYMELESHFIVQKID